MKVLVAYYSWKGHTETLARNVAPKLNADLVKIEPLEDPGSGMGGKAVKALFGLRAKIKPCLSDIKEFDQLVIATPVWAQKIPPYTREYLSGLGNCSGKKFSVLVEMGGSGGDKVVEIVRQILEAKGMKFVTSAQFIEKEVEAGKFEEPLDQFVTKIMAG